MARSRAEKARRKQCRERGIDPTLHRTTRPDFSTHVRTTPTKQTQLERQRLKHRVLND